MRYEFFYELTNHKIGASENNMQLDIKTNKKELIINNYLANKHLENISENHFQLSIK